MQEKEPVTAVNHTTKTNPVDAERTVATPHFDAAAMRQARPAVPLAEIRARRTWPVAMMLLMVLAGIAGGVIGGIISTGYLRRETAHTAVSQEIQPTNDRAADEATGEPAMVVHTALEQSPDELVKGLADAGLPRLFIPAPADFHEIDTMPLIGIGKVDLEAINRLARQLAATRRTKRGATR